jgi:hypothetical protein
MNTPPSLTQDIAEVIGVLLGDGCLSRSTSQGHTAFQVAFTGNTHEFWYYRDFVQPTLESAFGVEGHLYHRKDNTTRYHIFSKDLVFYFNSIGIPIGKKRDASIPSPILDQGLSVPFIRGIYHAEGSIYRRYSRPYNRHIRTYDNLLVIQIRMKLVTLMREIRAELATLGILPNRLTEKDGVFTLRITTQREISKFIRIIQPKYKAQPAPAKLKVLT